MAIKPKAPKPQYPGAETDTSLPLRMRLARALVTLVRKNPDYYPKSKAGLHTLALEFFRGAAIAASAINVEDGKNVMHNMFLVSVRGYAHVEELADEPSDKERVLHARPDATVYCRTHDGDTSWRRGWYVRTSDAKWCGNLEADEPTAWREAAKAVQQAADKATLAEQ